MLTLFSYKKKPKKVSKYIDNFRDFDSWIVLEKEQVTNFEIFLFQLQKSHYFLFWKECNKNGKKYLFLEVRKAFDNIPKFLLNTKNPNKTTDEDLYYGFSGKRIKEIKNELRKEIFVWNVEIFGRLENELSFKSEEELESLRKKLKDFAEKNSIVLKNEFTKQQLSNALRMKFFGIEYLINYVGTEETKKLFFKIYKNLFRYLISILFDYFSAYLMNKFRGV